MSDDNYGMGTLLEDEYYASQGVRTGSAYSESLVSQQESNKRIPDVNLTSNSYESSSSENGGPWYTIFAVIAIICIIWLWEQMANYEAHSFPYNFAASYYNFILREPLLVIGNSIGRIFIYVWNHSLTSNQLYNFAIGLAIYAVILFLFKWFIIYSVDKLSEFYEKNKIIRVALQGIFLMYVAPVAIILLYFIITLIGGWLLSP